MKYSRTHALLIAILMMAVASGRAQQAPSPAPPPQVLKSLRLQVVLTQYDGDKKISSLPYVLHISDSKNERASLRIGLRIPVANVSKDEQITYVDTGTNIDCHLLDKAGDLYSIEVTADRSWPVVSSSADNTAGSTPANLSFGTRPIIQQFRAQIDAVLRDGQTVTSTVATDPVTGRVIKMEVTLNEEK
ncbi:MAG: hypothetical protein ACLP1Y_06965 [Candidatus Acidiferrales bacterium]